MAIEKDYVLGTHDAEIARLGLQHRVWRPRVLDAWRRAGFTPGQTLVDLGCGPGWATLDLAELAGPDGRVIAVDRSRRFLDHLAAAARARGLANIETLEMDLDESPLPSLAADGIWSRWFYAFLRAPRRLLASAAQALRAGGVMVMHEYVDYRAWRLSPRSEEFEAFVGEVIAAWREDGGEPDIGLDLPRWLTELGLEVRTLAPRGEIARPGDFVWHWPRSFVEIGVQRLVDLGRFGPERGRAIVAAFERVETTPGAFQITPTVGEILAWRT